ncbi:MULTISPECIES: hypothetical protein [unclassified Streptomyces]|uniref:hypothetical protein n=1 Tax=unclassified Streptomyces TaxID=2593676 RepID=UPI001BE4F5B6|nr:MULTISPECIES: hypothetical protein [unclassified Streptomyces]MBT2403229.1 hypothetical protein [Streptomyces sp. ISL-21]MBT2610379.1 hypothetical protein [Streptomyces sp. ISL-87]
MSELIWHDDASIELSTSLPAEGGLPVNGKPERHEFRGARIAFRDGFVYIRPDANNLGRSGNRVFVVPATAVVRAELPNGAAEV